MNSRKHRKTGSDFTRRLASYLEKTDDELTMMGHGAISLMAPLFPHLFGNEQFDNDREYLDAVERGRRKLREMFPASPRSAKRQPVRAPYYVAIAINFKSATTRGIH